jgi:parallel beta-helix repeat protein
MRKTSSTFLFASLLLAACGSPAAMSSSSTTTTTTSTGTGGGDAGPPDLCAGLGDTCEGFTEGASEMSIAAAVAEAKDGATFVFGPGTFAFTNTLTFAAKNITIIGAGMDKTTLDFKGLAAGSSGTGIDVLDGSDGFTIKDIEIRDTKKNGVKVKGSNGVTFQHVKVDWTNVNPKTHGDYAVYPVFCKKVLVESCDISGSSDAGIYVGQSQSIIVRNNIAHENVAGIEIENSIDADVYMNTAKANTSGILVFDLPGSGNQHDGHNTRVHDNMILDNNSPNFNDTGSVISKVPVGIGTFVLGTRDVEIDHNTYAGNDSSAFAVVSYYLASPSWKSSQDAAYNPVSKRVYFHDNMLTNNGAHPDAQSQIGQILTLVSGIAPHMHVPEIVVDGIDATDPVDPVNGAPNGNPRYLCFKNNGVVDFVNLHLDMLKGDASNLAAIVTFDPAAYDCTLPTLPEVMF